MKEDPQFGRPLFQKWTALFFVLVMAGFGFVQAVHVHDALTSQIGSRFALLVMRRRA